MPDDKNVKFRHAICCDGDRYEALRPDFAKDVLGTDQTRILSPLTEYFRLDEMDPKERTEIQPLMANMYLAEDRILGYVRVLAFKLWSRN